ncbi:MAG: crotonase/enoyl-CoA hydratase family protein [Sphingobium sp.]
MMQDRVSVTVENGVADVRLSRPDKINAVDLPMFEGLCAAIDRIAADSSVRAVVLSGEGRGFCVGVDLDALADEPALLDLMPRTHGIANVFQYAAWGWRELPQPVIAAVHGFAFGAGFQIMLGADIRIAAPDAKLSLMEVRWGLCPDVAGIALLRGIVRDDIAREFTYTARQMDGEEAARVGIVTRTAASPRDEALALARSIAASSPHAVRASKRLFNMAAESDAAAILLAESEEQQLLLASVNHRETMAAAREKRARVFQDV